MKLLFNFVILTSLLVYPVQAEEIFVMGLTKIYNNNQIEAKEQALRNAQLNSVKKGVEKLLVKKTINQNYQVIKEQIYNFNKKFIIDFEIVNQDIDLEQKYVEIQIKANVDEEKILKKLQQLGMIHDRMGYKMLMVIYHGQTAEALSRENRAVQETIAMVQKTFAEEGFRTLNQKTMKQIYRALDQDIIDWRPVDILTALALNYNVEILVIMEMIPGERHMLNGSFFQVKSTVRFSVFDTVSGQQIAATSVMGIEKTLMNPEEKLWQKLLGTAGKQAALENVLQSTEHINHFYQNAGEIGEIYTIVFSGYSPRRESLIIDYLENNAEYQQLSELKNTFGHLELELFSIKRKSILRRRITSDLLKKEIEVATKTLPGYHLFFINPDPMEEIETIEDNETVSSLKNDAQVSPSQ
jgi:ethanolamine utilization microcompartment shell protein EutS